jgi:hypothetical protein
MTIDAQMEDPEERKFTSNLLHDLRRDRADLLVAALTIWRYGRVAGENIIRGKTLGSYEEWSAWVRDPLLTLGCKDPVEQMIAGKTLDPKRKRIAAGFWTWWKHHRGAEVTAHGLAPEVLGALGLYGRPRQYIATAIQRLDGVRINGFLLARRAMAGKWSADRYVLIETSDRHDAVDAASPSDDFGFGPESDASPGCAPGWEWDLRP